MRVSSRIVRLEIVTNGTYEFPEFSTSLELLGIPERWLDATRVLVPGYEVDLMRGHPATKK